MPMLMRTAQIVAKAVESAGFPADCLRSLPGNASHGKLLAALRAVQRTLSAENSDRRDIYWSVVAAVSAQRAVYRASRGDAAAREAAEQAAEEAARAVAWTAGCDEDQTEALVTVAVKRERLYQQADSMA